MDEMAKIIPLQIDRGKVTATKPIFLHTHTFYLTKENKNIIVNFRIFVYFIFKPRQKVQIIDYDPWNNKSGSLEHDGDGCQH